MKYLQRQNITSLTIPPFAKNKQQHFQAGDLALQLEVFVVFAALSFDSQHLHGHSQLPATSVPGNPDDFLTFVGTKHVCGALTYTHAKH